MPLWQIFKYLWPFHEGLFRIWQNFEPSLAILFSTHWAKCIVVSDQTLMYHLAIWSQWLHC